MRILLTISLIAAVIPLLFAAEISQPLENLSLSQLEVLRDEVAEELSDLASYSMRSGIGTAGHRSTYHPDPHHTEWIRVTLESETLIDQIILTPIIRRDPKLGLHGDGFPVDFRILAGTADHPEAVEIASFTEKDCLLPRIAPLRIDFEAIKASWVKLEATKLSSRDWDNQYILQLSEIMVFSGPENVALHCPVEVFSSTGHNNPSRAKTTLVDGQVPYLMDAAGGDKSIAFMSHVDGIKDPSLTIDLGQSRNINRIHFHTAELSDTIPQSAKPGVGISSHIQIEGAENSDFSDAVVLMEYKREHVFDAGPIIMRRFPETRCRYFRMNIIEPYVDGIHSTFGCAEIELFSNGRNVAKGKTAAINYTFSLPNRTLSAITDGRNLYGEILPIRDWMEQLARRHDLESALPRIYEEIENRYIAQRKNLQLVSWLAVLLAGGIGFTILISRNLQMRQIVRLKTRFAADLHDELGANLHAIGLLGDIAKDAIHSPDILVKAVDKIRALTERSGEAARHCAEMQEAEIFGKLPDDMQRTANRIMTDIDFNLSIEGEEILEKLPPRTKADLFLFYKESLVNISRHSGADKVDVHLYTEHKKIILVISDNGQGLSGDVPSSLKRRARLLGGQVSSGTSETGGASIILTFRPGKFKFRRTDKR
ncbi:Sensor histidine kinase LiaS [Pontiella desulfatans]|uniref:Sensor histidine kinase LiaS n=1 Tax=Pontiella desulfatans TaxID=2750659 RepID=A0A6C2U0R4_PONDE|nr:ATP-binding protein [Pontiella desulfatans]VGO13181.1 Sensor histidine kinase LiaS [Pontiella desulfatans]